MSDKKWKKHEKKLLDILSRWNDIYDNLIEVIRLKDARIDELNDLIDKQDKELKYWRSGSAAECDGDKQR